MSETVIGPPSSISSKRAHAPHRTGPVWPVSGALPSGLPVLGSHQPNRAIVAAGGQHRTVISRYPSSMTPAMLMMTTSLTRTRCDGRLITLACHVALVAFVALG